MNFRTIFLVFFSVISSDLIAKVVYVKAESNGDGSSWSNAIGDLQNGLRAAKSGDEVWVAKGVYYPTNTTDRTISFQIKAGVALYGGFAGTEAKLGDRIIKANHTVLSGEIGTLQKADNTLNVLYMAHATQTTIVDGFIITGGYAGGDEASGSRFASGGGLFNDGKGWENQSHPVISNCRFVENTARDGGAIYNNAANGGNCRLTLINCTFQNNKAFLGGGAVFNNASQDGNCQTNILNTQFSKNLAGFGGAIFNYGENGSQYSRIHDSQFLENKAIIQGGGIYNFGVNQSSLTNCEFADNVAPVGSTIANTRAAENEAVNNKKI